MKILKSKAFVALAIAGLAMLIWAYWRQARTVALKAELGINDFTYDDAIDWNNGENWDKYEPLSFEKP